MPPSSPSRPQSLVLEREKQVGDKKVTNDQPHIVLCNGEGQSFSFHQPTLHADIYSVTISQDTDTTLAGEDKKQDKDVAAPRFSLGQDQVVGFYPPQGHTVANNILPHIILRDQRLPWIRSGLKATHNAVPWLALLVFTDDELTIEPSEGFLPPGKEQNLAGGVSFTFQEIFDAQSQARITSPFSEHDPEMIDPTMSSNFVFVPGDVFGSLFCKYNDDGSPMEMKNGDVPDPTRYMYLAHIRKTTSLRERIEKDDEKGDKSPGRFYSTVVSHRTAPVDLKKTTIVSVHLVSIENVMNVVTIPDGKRVAMCSLHSWTYKVSPSGTKTFRDKVIHLGNTLDVLRPPLKGAIDTLASGTPLPPDMISRLETRIHAGYTLVRDDRLSTGNQDIAFTRSPCVPGRVAPIPNLTPQSWTSEENLRDFDQNLGIMDITYSSAWQLGKSLAVADPSFTTALGYLSMKIGDAALKEARLEFEETGSLTAQTTEEGLPDFSTTNPDFLSRHEHYCIAVSSALSKDTDGATLEAHSDPNWKQVFTFLLDRLFLYSVPTHYLLPDPALLPEESLRFFSIDKNWTNASIDGALSVANHHQQPKLDVNIRTAIKQSFQAFLAEPIPEIRYPPQVPTYGMLLRSDIVSRFPNLSIHAPYPNPDDLRAPILRQTPITDDTILVLFDRVPYPQQLQTLTIQLPPHEERFSVGSEIDGDNLTIDWKCIYTHNPSTNDLFPRIFRSKYRRNDGIESPTGLKVYDWPSRTLNMDAYTTTALAISQDKKLTGMFDEAAKTTVVATIELFGSIAVDLANELYSVSIGMAFSPQSPHLSLESPVATDDPLDETDTRYEYGIWPIYSILSERPGDNIYPIPSNVTADIVFSIVRKGNWSTAPYLNLRSLEINLTLDGVSAIMTGYAGSGAYLATNMRWTEFIKFSADGTQLIVGVLPRDTDRGWSPVGDNKGITFVLKDCKVQDGQVSGVATVNEYYDQQTTAASGLIYYKLVPHKDGE
ncbi:hypothetical protein AX15_004534 [Amanita polypyramis BW_CC]|nr:hypothetical protein AX15_004534 [Amanita polypyramis BW_CC]